MERTVKVDLGPRSYDINIAPGILQQLGTSAARIQGVSAAVVISDSTVAKLYGRQALDSLKGAGLRASLIDFPAGEPQKNLQTYAQLMDKLLGMEPPIDRNCLIVALGGGVPGDVAGFVAATALRGLKLIQCPTTLVAMVDSSVGGKTGVDHSCGKNLIGAFYQPGAVVADVHTLKTLPAAELRSGLAECVKHGVIRDASLLDLIEASAEQILACDEDVMTDFIARNVAIKAAVVADDEREAGARAHLNFGHTIGHAIEVFIGYDKMPHGQAVAIGMVAANCLAVAKGLLNPADAERVKALLKQLGLPVGCDGLDAAKIWQIMQHDKKARDGRVRMVLPRALGKVDIFDDIKAEEVQDAIAALAKS